MSCRGALLGAALPLILVGLLPVVAQADVCPNEALRVGPSANLPDCRVYELVSPLGKNGAYINEGSFISSPEGESAGFTSTSGFAGATSTLYTSTGYQSSRGGAGWGTVAETQSEGRYVDHHSLLKPDYLDESFGGVDPGLEGGGRPLEGGVRLYLLQEFGQPEADLDFYRTGADGANVLVGPAVPPTAVNLAQSSSPEESEYIKVLGWSADASHMVFTDPEGEGPNQWPGAQPGSLLEYAGSGNSQPLLVGVDNSGHFVNNCPTQYLGGVSNGEFNTVNNPISADGRRVFFTDGCDGELFARVDGGQAGAHTVAISDPITGATGECAQCTDSPGAPGFSRFVGASQDGSKVFFYTSEPLLGGSEGLYEYDFDAPEGGKVVQVAAGSFGRTAVVQVAQDGSRMYFFSESVLTEEASPDVPGRDGQGGVVQSGSVAQAGADNLYVFERDARYPEGHLGFVAALGESDRFHLESSVTPDGRFLVLDVHTPLTAGDGSTASQVFEYDAQSGAMVRASIGQGGYGENGLALLEYPGSPVYEGNTVEGAVEDEFFNDANDAVLAHRSETESTFSPASYADHLSVSADGSYVFFASPLALVPHALDRSLLDLVSLRGTPQAAFAENVYEYHAGSVYLISDGRDLSSHSGTSQVHLLSTDLSGRDVFFETVDPLAPQDTDSNKDIYDARVDGGFAAPSALSSCPGEGCQTRLTPAPVLLSPGSEFQAGGGNLAPVAKAPAKKTPRKKAKAKTKKKAKAKRKKTKARGKPKSRKGDGR